MTLIIISTPPIFDIAWLLYFLIEEPADASAFADYGALRMLMRFDQPLRLPIDIQHYVSRAMTPPSIY